MFKIFSCLFAMLLLSVNLADAGTAGQISKQLKQTGKNSSGTTTPKTLSSSIFKDSVTGMEFIFVKGGCYQMGDVFNYNGDDPNPAEKPVHEVCVDDFYLGKYEVTQAQWKKIMGTNTLSLCGDKCDCPPNGDNCPVSFVKYNEVQDFINKLNKISGGNKYRLPTEAEWEYAARSGGKNERYSGGDELNKVAWYNETSNYKLHAVGTKAPNGLGIYDMSGNVWEMVSDWYGTDYYEKGPRSNPKGPSAQAGPELDHVVRGGCASGGPGNVRTMKRNHIFESAGSAGNKWSLGFRLLKTP